MSSWLFPVVPDEGLPDSSDSASLAVIGSTLIIYIILL